MHVNNTQSEKNSQNCKYTVLVYACISHVKSSIYTDVAEVQNCCIQVAIVNTDVERCVAANELLSKPTCVVHSVQ